MKFNEREGRPLPSALVRHASACDLNPFNSTTYSCSTERRTGIRLYLEKKLRRKIDVNTKISSPPLIIIRLHSPLDDECYIFGLRKMSHGFSSHASSVASFFEYHGVLLNLVGKFLEDHFCNFLAILNWWRCMTENRFSLGLGVK
jgi:hypothetical protein